MPVWADCVESYLTTDPRDNCNATSASNDEDSDAWPPDLDDSQFINIQDIQKLMENWAKELGVDIDFAPRKDLVADGFGNIQDVQLQLQFWAQSCT